MVSRQEAAPASAVAFTTRAPTRESTQMSVARAAGCTASAPVGGVTGYIGYGRGNVGPPGG